MDHRLSRPAPYQARRTPPRIFCSERNLKKVSINQPNLISAKDAEKRLHAKLLQSMLYKRPQNKNTEDRRRDTATLN
jgi:hypothetical protein